MNTFISKRYEDIVVMTKRICKGSSETEDVAHYCIQQFMEHKRAEELVEKNEAMKFLSGMIHRSFHSSTSPYHKIYRQSGRVHELYDYTINKQSDYGFSEDRKWHKKLSDYQNVWYTHDEEYDIETDLTIEAIQGLLEEMLAEGVDQWFRATLFKMWLQQSNYSELARVTRIPRTTISQAVKECREYIQQTLKQRGIE